ncbi:MAG: YedE family putative selenium transporter [Clostridia bacterium]|nr:YedE family putative selenium transporter [Clostridia bacterium]
MQERETKFKRIVKDYWLIILTGLAVGAAAVILSALGNPKNMGFCIACFLRDGAGALGFHSAAVVQYVRPEIIGLVLGSMIIAMIGREWRPMGGSSPMTRFLLGVIVMIGALIFLGCPLRMVIRLGGGDLNALVGLLGFIAGILIGIVPLKLGFSLKRAYKQSRIEGLVFPVMLIALALIAIFGGGYLNNSVEGPGSQRANFFVALLISAGVGALCQRSRLCMAGGMRDAVMFKDFRLISGFIAIIVAVLAGNLIVNGSLSFGFENQPVAHTDGIFNFLGMTLVGWGSVLLGGCPLRQLILAGEGNSDSAITVTGFVTGAAVAHNFGLASSANGIGGGPVLIVVLASFAALILISVFNIAKGGK